MHFTPIIGNTKKFATVIGQILTKFTFTFIGTQLVASSSAVTTLFTLGFLDLLKAAFDAFWFYLTIVRSVCIRHHRHISSKRFPVKTTNKSYPQSQLLSLETQRLTSSPRWPQSSSAYFLRYCFSYSDHGPEGQQRHVDMIHADQQEHTSSYRTFRDQNTSMMTVYEELIPCGPCRLVCPQ